jgi:DNA-binding CsgD family transcriptional regulator
MPPQTPEQLRALASEIERRERAEADLAKAGKAWWKTRYELERKLHEGETRRDRAILKAISSGMSYQRAAELVGISKQRVGQIVQAARAKRP